MLQYGSAATSAARAPASRPAVDDVTVTSSSGPANRQPSAQLCVQVSAPPDDAGTQQHYSTGVVSVVAAAAETNPGNRTATQSVKSAGQNKFTRAIHAFNYVTFLRLQFLFCFTNSLWRRGVVVSGVRRMNEVSACWARLVPGWMTDTVFARVYHLGM